MASLHRKLCACFWARACRLQCQGRDRTQKGHAYSSVLCRYQVPCCRDENGPHESYTPLLLSGLWLGLGSSTSPMLLLPFKKAKWVWGKGGTVKGASSSRWVIFTLLMNYFPRQACLREAWVTEDKVPSHHSLTWVTHLNNIILVLTSLLFLKNFSFLMLPKPSITMNPPVASRSSHTSHQKLFKHLRYVKLS